MKKKWSFLICLISAMLAFVSIYSITKTSSTTAFVASSYIRVNNPYPSDFLLTLEKQLNHEIIRETLIEKLSVGEYVDYMTFNASPEMGFLRLDIKVTDTTREIAEKIPGEIVIKLNELPPIATLFEMGKKELETSYRILHDKDYFASQGRLLAFNLSEIVALENRYQNMNDKHSFLELNSVTVKSRSTTNFFFLELTILLFSIALIFYVWRQNRPS